MLRGLGLGLFLCTFRCLIVCLLCSYVIVLVIVFKIVIVYFFTGRDGWFLWGRVWCKCWWLFRCLFVLVFVGCCFSDFVGICGVENVKCYYVVIRCVCFRFFVVGFELVIVSLFGYWFCVWVFLVYL